MADARIIYITGMKPKPIPESHRPELVRVLAASLARVAPEAGAWLGERPENFTLVSWTRLLYSDPRDINLDRGGVDRLLAAPQASAVDRREADSRQLALLRIWHLLGDSYPWLSSIVASPALTETLTDVYRYLDNQDDIARKIRQMLSDALESAWAAGDRVLLIGHSLGSVIAYDCLWSLSRERFRQGRIELFMTLGSPLATRFIRCRLQGAGQTGQDRFPDNIDRWVNVSARGELVALHRRVRPFFGAMVNSNLIESIEDVPAIYNHFRRDDGSLDPHKSYGYLNHAAVATRICRWLNYSS